MDALKDVLKDKYGSSVQELELQSTEFDLGENSKYYNHIIGNNITI